MGVEGRAGEEEPRELVERYGAYLRVQRGASEHTVRAYLSDLDDYLRWAQRSEVDPLRPTFRQLRLYLGELDQARYQRATVRRRLSSLRGFFSWMVGEGVVEENPAASLTGPKKNQTLPHVLRPPEMARLLSVHAAVDEQGRAREQTDSDVRDQALLEFLYASGARVSEASQLLARDVDLDQRQVKVLGKGGKERMLPIHDLAVDSMRRYALMARPRLLDGKECPNFFVSTRGNPMGTDAMRKMFKATVRAAGLDEDLSPHDMRHTFATDMLNGGADLRTVQELLGHASLSTTQIYTHLTPERLMEEHHQAHPRG